MTDRMIPAKNPKWARILPPFTKLPRTGSLDRVVRSSGRFSSVFVTFVIFKYCANRLWQRPGRWRQA